MRTFLSCISIIFTLSFLFLSPAFGIENVLLEVHRVNNYLTINSEIIPSEDFMEDFKSGLSKNILVTIELFKKWSIIPDEFIKGVQIQRNLLSDPIKGEFTVKSQEGSILFEKRFKNADDAIEWALKLNSVKIGDVNQFEKGRYYIKVTVESNIKKLPSVLEHILFFIPKYEKRISKESETFRLP